MHIEPNMPGLRISRTFPQPDAPQLGASGHNRALAVFKYLLGLNPEQAIKHPMFDCIRHSYTQQFAAAHGRQLGDSLVAEFGMAEIATIPCAPPKEP